MSDSTDLFDLLSVPIGAQPVVRVPRIDQTLHIILCTFLCALHCASAAAAKVGYDSVAAAQRLPGDLERQIEAFIEHYNHGRTLHSPGHG
jgi:hypothetical protein